MDCLTYTQPSLRALKALGVNSTCYDLHVISLKDEGGPRDYLVVCVGQHVALHCLLDARMKMLTMSCLDVKRITAVAVAPNEKIMATCELVWSKASLDEKADSVNQFLCTKHSDSRISLFCVCTATLKKILVSSSTHDFIATAFGPDSTQLGFISQARDQNGGQGCCLSASSSTQMQLITFWSINKVKAYASSQFAIGQAKQIKLSYSVNGSLFAVTIGMHHCRIWYLSDFKIKAIMLLSKSQEMDSNFPALDLGVSDSGRNNVHSFKSLHANLSQQVYSNVTDRCSQSLVLLNGQEEDIVSETKASQRSTSQNEYESALLFFQSIDRSLNFAHVYTVRLPIQDGSAVALTSNARGICVAGTKGYFALLECGSDAKAMYSVVRSFNVTVDVPKFMSPSWTSLASSNTGDFIVAAAGSAVYVFPLKDVDPLDAEHDQDCSRFFTPMIQGVFTSIEPILEMDASAQKSLLATCSYDGTIRIWNTVRHKCDIVQYAGLNASSCQPITISLHPLGVQLTVGHSETVRFYSILSNSLKLLHEIPVVKCHVVRYAHGGHQIACAAGVAIIIISSVTLHPLFCLAGDTSPIHLLTWTDCDSAIFSVAKDGSVYGWNVPRYCKVHEVTEIFAQTNATSQYLALAAGALSESNKVSCACQENCMRYRIVGASRDGVLHEVGWTTSTENHTVCTNLKVANLGSTDCVIVTALCPSPEACRLFAGTSAGTIRVYMWHDEGLSNEYSDFPAHAGNVTSICFHRCNNQLISAGQDGIIFIFSIVPFQKETACSKNVLCIHSPSSDMPKDAQILSASDQVVQVNGSELEDNAIRLAELSACLEKQAREHEFALHRKDMDCEIELKEIKANKEQLLIVEREKYDFLYTKYQADIVQHHTDLAQKDSQFIRATHELENKYDTRLATEIVRYELLCKEIDAIQQRCNSTLQAQASLHESEMRLADSKAKKIEKDLRQQIDRLYDDAYHNEHMFREVLDQQEHEYETELQQLMVTAQSELIQERENTTLAMGQVQAKKAKISRLTKRMDELKTASHARNILLTGEKVRSVELEKTLSNVKKHMEERESTLEDKELSILSLNRKNLTRESVCFVLDTRVKKLLHEKQKIMQHIDGLDSHIAAMYDELEKEYSEKKRLSQDLRSKESRITTLTNEMIALRGFLRERDTYIASFKREISTLIGLTTYKSLEDAVRKAYRKFVKIESNVSASTHTFRSDNDYVKMTNSCVIEGKERSQRTFATKNRNALQIRTSKTFEVDPNLLITRSEKPCEDAASQIFDALREAHYQKDCVQRVVSDLLGRLHQARCTAQAMKQRRICENSDLIEECNDVKAELGFQARNRL